MLLFTEWVTPDFSIDGFWTYVGATIVIWLVNWLVWTLVDRCPAKTASAGSAAGKDPLNRLFGSLRPK